MDELKLDPATGEVIGKVPPASRRRPRGRERARRIERYMQLKAV
jgi:hypothetical protein